MKEFGEQLMLPFEGGLERVRIPWDGRSPRALTRAALSSIFKAQAVKSTSDLVLSNQIEMFSLTAKGPLYEGASLLLPFDSGGRHG